MSNDTKCPKCVEVQEFNVPMCRACFDQYTTEYTQKMQAARYEWVKRIIERYGNCTVRIKSNGRNTPFVGTLYGYSGYSPSPGNMHIHLANGETQEFWVGEIESFEVKPMDENYDEAARYAAPISPPQ